MEKRIKIFIFYWPRQLRNINYSEHTHSQSYKTKQKRNKTKQIARMQKYEEEKEEI